MKRKIDMAKRAIAEAMDHARRPAVLSSFGKDSMVLLHLVRETVPRELLTTHAFPLPVLYFRDPWFAHKHAFAEQIVNAWGIELHLPTPVAAGVKCNSERLELVARYSLGLGYIDVPKNVCAPAEYPRRDYLCGLRDWMMRPKAGQAAPAFDLYFHGHKSSDVDHFDGHVPLRADRETLNDAIELAFPLRHWTDADVWEYLELNHIPFQTARYDRDGHQEKTDKWFNNDYTHACTACIDPRNAAPRVHCPKLNAEVVNVGARVLRLEHVPDYIAEAQAKENENYALESRS